MTENVDSFVLEQLKAIRVEQSAARDRNVEVIRRVSGLESMVARLGRDKASAFAERVDDRHSIDQLCDRIERIERRLDLTN